MVLESFEQLAQRARSLPRRTVAVAAAHDAHALEAVRDAAAEGLVDYLLVGDPGEIRELAAGLGFSPDPERIIPEGDGAIFLHTGGAPGLWSKEHLDDMQAGYWSDPERDHVHEMTL